MAKPWTNADGLQVKFGNYWNDRTNFYNRPRVYANSGSVRTLKIDYDLPALGAGGTGYTADLNNDGTADGFDFMDTYIPANSSVLRVVLLVTVAAAGGTSIILGTYQKNGTAISTNSLITATEGVLANLDTVGARTFGAGALVATTAETAGVGVDDAYVALKATGTFTAGQGRIYIDYMMPLADAAP